MLPVTIYLRAVSRPTIDFKWAKGVAGLGAGNVARNSAPCIMILQRAQRRPLPKSPMMRCAAYESPDSRGPTIALVGTIATV